MRWTKESLQELVVELRSRRGDTTTVEVKAAAGGCPDLGETLCAFANMPEGGTIILGLDESAGFRPVGLSNLAELERGVAAQARTGVAPPVRCDFQTFQVDGAPVLVVDVEGLPLHDRPARHGGQSFLRQSDGDYVMSQQELAQLELLKTQAVRPTNPDRQPVPETSLGDLDPDLVRAFIASARDASRRLREASDEELLQLTGVVTASGELTLAGVYALGRYPQAFSPSLSITAAVPQPPGSGVRTRDLQHLDGPLPELLDRAMDWVRRNTRTSIGYDERGHGVDLTELPMRAVREIVANALVHRNLDGITNSKRVEIRLYDDKLVITSPGGLWGVSGRQLGRPGGKSAVNPLLYDLCTLVRMVDGSRVIEGEGGGIREALQALLAAGLRPPTFVDSGVQFTVLVWRHTLLSDSDLDWLGKVAPGAGLSSEQRAILAGMRHGQTWTNSSVRAEFGPVDSVEARRMLQQLVDLDLARASGVRGNTTYALARRLSASKVHEAPKVHEILDAVPEPAAPARGQRTPFGTLTKHGDVLGELLRRPRTIKELMQLTGLKESQVRYALRRLIDAGVVAMQGAQGLQDTRYELTETGRALTSPEEATDD